LRDAVARALARRDEARQRHAELERERADLENERRWLEREAQEEKILALGAARRNRSIDWAGVRIRWGARWGREGMEFRTSPAAAVALALMPFVMLLLGVLAAVCGKR
jgi:hypothetical protein